MTPAPCRVSCVIPAHNEERLIASTVAAIVARWGKEQSHELAEVIVVDDGSTDRTREVVRSLTADVPGLRLVRQDKLGKGAALKRGVLESTGEVVYFIDADLPFGADDQVALTTRVSASRPVVCGDRTASEAQTHNSVLRLAASKVFAAGTRLFTGLSLPDSQCGLKAFDGDVGRRFFGELTEPGFAMDVELLLRMANAGVPISHHPVHLLPEQRTSSVRPLRAGMAMSRSLVQIRRTVPRYGSAGVSRRASAQVDRVEN